MDLGGLGERLLGLSADLEVRRLGFRFGADVRLATFNQGCYFYFMYFVDYLGYLRSTTCILCSSYSLILI